MHKMRKLFLELSKREWKECPLLNQYYQEAKEYLKDCESGVFPWSDKDIKTAAIDDILSKIQKENS